MLLESVKPFNAFPFNFLKRFIRYRSEFDLSCFFTFGSSYILKLCLELFGILDKICFEQFLE